jgi:membrane-bound ClpP family serine protease
MESDLLLWASILLLLGLALALLEVFVPSSGILGFLSIVSIVAAIVLAFRHGVWSGIGFFGVTIIALPVGLILALQYWPKTPMGRRILLPLPRGDEVLPDSDKRRSLRALVGKLGRAKSLMLPSGAVTIEGQTFDALSEGMAIVAGQMVRVVEVRGTRVVVRPVDEQSAPGEPVDDAMQRPIDDPFDDPLV